MPFNDPPPLPGLAGPLQDLLRRMDNLEARLANLQNGSITATDSSGRVRMVIGALNGPPATEWGVQIFDSSGNEQVRLGQLNVSPDIFGLGILPQETGTTGALQMVGGKIFLLLSPPGTFSGTSYTAYPGTNSVGINVGPSGIFAVTVSAFVSTTTAPSTGFIGYKLDSGAVQDAAAFSGTAANQGATISETFDVATTPGAHTIEFFYKVSAGSSTISGNTVAVIEPL